MSRLQHRSRRGFNSFGATLLLLVCALLSQSAFAASLGAARFHGLWVKDDGTLAAWGYNASGQVGDGTNLDRSFPVPTLAIDGVVAGRTFGVDRYASNNRFSPNPALNDGNHRLSPSYIDWARSVYFLGYADKSFTVTQQGREVSTRDTGSDAGGDSSGGSSGGSGGSSGGSSG